MSNQVTTKVSGMRIFCIANQKGGVGKTTTTVNLAAGLAQAGRRVLLVDLDPQGNATMGSGIDKRALDPTVYDVLLETTPISAARKRSPTGGYDVLGANRELAGAEVELVELEHREKRLKLALQAVKDDYDFVLIDCPPSLSMLTLNGLCAVQNGVINVFGLPHHRKYVFGVVRRVRIAGRVAEGVVHTVQQRVGARRVGQDELGARQTP